MDSACKYGFQADINIHENDVPHFLNDNSFDDLEIFLLFSYTYVTIYFSWVDN